MIARREIAEAEINALSAQASWGRPPQSPKTEEMVVSLKRRTKRPPRRGASNFARDGGPHTFDVAAARVRYPAKQRPAKPSSIIAQVEDSGTAAPMTSVKFWFAPLPHVHS
jgi:hypothetical protein